MDGLTTSLPAGRSHSLDLVLDVINGAHEDEEHLLVEARDVVPDHEDDGAQLARNRNGILRVHLLLLIRCARGDQVLVNHAGLNRTGEFDQKLTVSKLGVTKALDRGLRLDGLIDPGEEVSLRLGSHNLEVMDSHELPDDSKNVLFVPLGNILGSNTDHLDSEELHGLLSQVAVEVSVEGILGRPVGLLHVDTGGVNAVADTQKDETIFALFKQVLDEAVLDLHRVDPESEGALLTGALNVIVDDAGLLDFFLRQLLKAVLAVEHRGNENRVNLRISFKEIAGANAVLDSHGGRRCEHLGGSRFIVGLIESVQGAVGGVELVKHVDEGSAILEVSAKVTNLWLISLLEMEVHPAEQDVFRLHLLQLGQLLAILEKAIDFRHLRQLNVVHGDEANELPQDTEHKISRLVKEALSVNANDFDHSFSCG